MKEIKLKAEDGREWIQSIVYENLPVQCGIYKSFNHYAKDCPEKRLKDEERRTKEKQENSNQRREGDQEWKTVPKQKAMKTRKNFSKQFAKTPTKSPNKSKPNSGKDNHPTTSKNPYVVLGILEGSDNENINYNSDFSENETTNMEVIEVIEGEEGEEVRGIIKRARNVDNRATTTTTQHQAVGSDRDNIPSRNILNTRKTPNVGQPHVGRPSAEETRSKLTEQDIANGKQ